MVRPLWIFLDHLTISVKVSQWGRHIRRYRAPPEEELKILKWKKLRNYEPWLILLVSYKKERIWSNISLFWGLLLAFLILFNIEEVLKTIDMEVETRFPIKIEHISLWFKRKCSVNGSLQLLNYFKTFLLNKTIRAGGYSVVFKL